MTTTATQPAITRTFSPIVETSKGRFLIVSESHPDIVGHSLHAVGRITPFGDLELVSQWTANSYSCALKLSKLAGLA
jgi:hypothetical protein